MSRRSAGLVSVACAVACALPTSFGLAEETPAQLYAAFCADCHGARLEGSRAPSLLDPHWRRGDARRELMDRIGRGMPSKGMPSWSGTLSTRQIEGLADFIASRPVEAGTTSSEATERRVETDQYLLRIETVLEQGLEQPKSLAILPSGVLLVSDREGMRVIRNGIVNPQPLAGLPPLDTLEEIALQGTRETDWLYITYVCSKACGHPDRHVYALARGHLRDNRWTDHQALLEFGDGDHVYGVSKLAFDSDHHVYFTLSGAEHPGRDPADFEAELRKAQDLSSHRGKIFRVRDDGRVPHDNPFVDRPGALPIIWSYGHRGLSGLCFESAGHTLWSTEHGPWGGDELNRVVRAGNYGWPLVSFGYHYAGKPIAASQAPGIEPPLFHWTPSVGVSTVQVYTGAAFPKWRGNILVGALGGRTGRTLYRFDLDQDRALLYKYPSDAQGKVLRDAKGAALPRVPRYEEIAPDVGRIRDTRIGPEGFIYLLLENPNRIVRLVPAAS